MELAFFIVERDDQPVLSIRTSTSMSDLPETILQALMKVGEHLARLGAQPSGPAFVAYSNLDMRNLTVEIGFPVAGKLAGTQEVTARIIPGGSAGVCLYTGPYQELASVYQQVNAYLEGQGCELTGVSYEFYLNDPAVTPPAELQTQIVFPLAGAAIRERERAPGNGRIPVLYR